MKSIKVLFTIVLSMLFLGIAMYPCTDSYVSIDSLVSTTVTQEKEHASHGVIDSCSPLCACVCCAASITVALTLRVPIVVVLNTVNHTPLPFDSLVQGEEKPIWQPPKIA